VVGLELVDADANVRTRRAVAVVLGEVEHAVAPRDLHVDRRVWLEAVLPVDPEAEPIDVEGARLRLIEDAQDGDGRGEVHGFERMLLGRGSGMQLLPVREHLHELGNATGARLSSLGVLHSKQNSVTVA
jgi:hypothetical protein